MKTNNLKSILGSVASISQVFKGDNKKWSAKRSVSGVLVAAVVHDVSLQGVTWMNCLLAFIAVLPLVFSVFESNTRPE